MPRLEIRTRVRHNIGMSEKMPNADLYDAGGRVQDVDAAREMADLEDRHREDDKQRVFGPRKKEVEEREVRLTEVGSEVLARKKEDATRHEAYEQAETKRWKEREEFIKRKLVTNNISQEKWDSFPQREQSALELKWKRETEKPPEYFLERRLETLIGKKVSSFKVGDFGDVELKFDDGAVLSFTSWDAYNDAADYDAVEVDRLQEKETGK